MSIFITIEEIITDGLDNYVFLACVQEGLDISEHIYGSHLFSIPKESCSYMDLLRRVDIDKSLVVICYDYSGYEDSSKAYWGLTSVGFEVKVLTKTPQLIPKLAILPGSPSPLKHKKTFLREINFGIAISKRMLKEYSKIYEVLKINYIGFDITDQSGYLLDREEIKKFFEIMSIQIPKDFCVVHGKKAYIGALLLKYLGKENLIVVLEDFNIKEERSESKTSFVDDSFYGSLLESSLRNSTAFTKNISTEKKKSYRGQRTCSKCEII